MSDSRQQALAGAIQLAVAGKVTAENTVTLAAEFHAFLNGSDAGTSASAKTSTSAAPATKVSPPKDTKPASGSKSTASAKPKVDSEPKDEPETQSNTGELVGKAIADLLSANLKTQAIALLGTYGAKSKSSLAEKDHASFLEAAGELLAAGELTA